MLKALIVIFSTEDIKAQSDMTNAILLQAADLVEPYDVIRQLLEQEVYRVYIIRMCKANKVRDKKFFNISGEVKRAESLIKFSKADLRLDLSDNL